MSNSTSYTFNHIKQLVAKVPEITLYFLDHEAAHDGYGRGRLRLLI